MTTDRNLESRQELNQGLGDGMSRAFEVAFTPAIFSLVGLGIDKWLGTVPVFTIGLFLFAIVGVFIKMWYAYDLEMTRQSEKRTWAQRSTGQVTP